MVIKINSKLNKILILLIISHMVVNLIGALGPELSFDALWYHLTLPKLYLINKSFSVIPGNLLYYSAFPQLTELIYAACLKLNGEILSKFVHFLFGLGCLGLIYEFFKKFGKTLALSGCLIFYSQLVVGWLSTTAYVDLVRTFMEIVSLVYFMKWFKLQQQQDIIKTGISLGLAISTKLLSLTSLLTFGLIIVIFKLKPVLKNIIILFFFSLIIPLPFLVRSMLATGNPIYPIFTTWFFNTQANGLNLSSWLLSRNWLNLILTIFKTVYTKGDILTPVFLIGLPLIIYYFSKTREFLVVFSYFIINFLFFFFTPLNYNRFLLPYLPSFIYLLIYVLHQLKKQNKIIINGFYIIVVATSLLNLISRGAANLKFIPFILGQQTKRAFLTKYLNFRVGNFYDTDSWFKNNIKNSDKVLVIGTHNLFYLDFPFDHISFAKPGTYYTHVLVQNQELPIKFGWLAVLYNNDLTGVTVYSYNRVWQ